MAADDKVVIGQTHGADDPEAVLIGYLLGVAAWAGVFNPTTGKIEWREPKVLENSLGNFLACCQGRILEVRIIVTCWPRRVVGQAD